MKNRFVAFILIFAICLTSFCVIKPNDTLAASSDYDYSEDIELLYNLGVIDSLDNSNKKVTRGEAAIYIAKFMNLTLPKEAEYTSFVDVMTSDECCTATNGLYDLGIISRSEQMMYFPKRNITHYELIKMIVSVLGYNTVAHLKGGYPLGYTFVADKIGVLNGLNIQYQDEVMLLDLYALLANALLADIYDVVGASGNAVIYDTIEGKSALSVFFDMNCEVGLIEKNLYTSLYSSTDDCGGLFINGRTFKADDKYCDYIGKNVRYYYDDESSTIVYLEEYRSDSFEVSCDDIDNMTNVYVEYQDGDRRAKLNFSDIVRVFRNGKLFTGFGSLKNLKCEHGYFEFIDNDNNNVIDVIKIWDFQPVVVKSFTKNPMIIFDKITNKAIEIKDTYGVTCLSADNTEVPVDEISVGDVLLIAMSGNAEKNELVKIYVSNNVIDGKVSTIDGDLEDCVINDKTYKIGATATNDVKIGERHIYYIDSFGYVVYVDVAVDDEYKFSVVSDTFLDLGRKKQLEIKLYNDQNNMEVITCIDHVYIDSEKYRIKELTDTVVDNAFVPGELLLYKQRGDTYEFLTPNSDSLENIHNSDSLRYRNGMCSSVFIMDKNTKIFTVPTDLDEDDMYGMLDMSSFTNGKHYQHEYSVYVYGDNPVNIASAVIFKGMAGSSIAPQTSATMVTRKYYSSYRDMDVAYIEGVQGSTVVNVPAEMNFWTENDIEVGDIIRYGVGTDGLCNSLEKVYDIAGDDENAILRPGVKGGTVDTSTTNPDADHRLVYGTIIDHDDNYIKFKTSYIDSSGNAVENIYIAKGQNIAIFDTETETAEAITINELVPGYEFVIKMVNSNFAQMFVIK